MTNTVDAIRAKLHDPEYARGLLTGGFIRSAIHGLYALRRAAGLTQADVADSMGCKQSNVARIENYNTGELSLKLFASFALACGKVPMLMFVDVDEVLEYVDADPTASRTAEEFLAWRAARQRMLAGAQEVRQEFVQDRQRLDAWNQAGK